MTGRDIPDDYRRDPEAFAGTAELTRLLYGHSPNAELNRIEHFTQFGWLGYTATVYDAHLQFLEWLNNSLEPVGQAFDPMVIRKWRTVNRLLLESYQDDWLKSEGQPLAALAGFPLLEEVARKLCGFWNEDGKMLKNPPPDIEFRRLSQSGDGWSQHGGYTEGAMIVLWAHKLELMRWTLPEGFRNSLAQLDTVVDKPLIHGATQPDANLFERLQYSRDVRSHGLRYEGIDAWWLTLLLAMLYFRLPPYTASDTPELAE